MDFFALREPVSALSHFAWWLLSLPGIWLLWRRGRGDRSKQISLVVYGASLSFCFASSSLFHGARLSQFWVEGLDRLDHIAIYVLIAGSYTPLAWNMMKGWTRGIVLLAAWSSALAGAVQISVYGLLPTKVSTVLYLAMGWGAIFCYIQIARVSSHRALFPLLFGGFLYSVGAVINVMGWPVIWPGVIQAHELFHLFVMAGSLVHFSFMLDAVVPFAWTCPLPAAGIRVDRAAPTFAPLPGRLAGWGFHFLWPVPTGDSRPAQSRAGTHPRLGLRTDRARPRRA